MVEKVEEEESFFHLFKTIGSTGNKNEEDDEKDEAQVKDNEALGIVFLVRIQFIRENFWKFLSIIPYYHLLTFLLFNFRSVNWKDWTGASNWLLSSRMKSFLSI